MRRWLETTVLPVWLATPLVVLGLAFVVLHPLGGITNGKYLLALLAAGVVGVLMRSRYEQKVLERSDRGVVYSLKIKGREEEPPTARATEDLPERVSGASERRERGVVAGGVRVGFQGFVGCLTFAVLTMVALLLLAYGCTSSA